MKNIHKKPPALASWMIEKLSLQYHKQMAIGDIGELYLEILEEDGKKRARRWYWRQTIKSIPFLIRNLCYGSTTMFKNYLKITLRNITNNKLSTTINILGLSVGMACFILIFLWINDELSFDKFHPNKDQLYLLTIKHPNDALDPNVPYGLPPMLASEFPEIIGYTRIYRIGKLMTSSFKYVGDDGHPITFYEDNINLVDGHFFSMFSFPFVHGNPETALTEPNSLVINEEIAEKYFGQENPVGKNLNFDNRQNLVVTGVIRMPANSHLQLDFIIPLPNPMANDWNWRDPSYILLDSQTPLEDFQTKISGSLNAHYPHPLGGTFQVGLLPITKVHLGFGQMSYIYIFSVIAVFILIIACINYMNLSTARSGNRAKEVGLRKVVGADRAQLIIQFLGESLIMSVVAMVLSILLVQICLPILNRLTLKHLTLFPINTPFLIIFIGLVLFVGLLAGFYPALFLTSSNPLRSLRASLIFKNNRSLFRLISVVGQFTISVLLIACTFIVQKQLDFMQKRPLGFNTDLVLKIPLNTGLRRHFESFKNELLNNPSITHATTSQAQPFNEDYKTSGVEWDGKDPDMVPNVRYSITDLDYIETFQMEIIEGRSFSNSIPGDRQNFVINEEAVKYFDMDEPIGQRLRFWGTEGTIIGIVKNFHHVSLHREIMPHVLTISQNYGRWLRYIYVRVRSENVPDTINKIEETAIRIAPDYPFEYSFLDQGIGHLYETEQRLGQIIGYFSCVAIFISCLGIFGLSAYTAEQRTKEIGIRKVLGASSPGIVVLLSKEFSRWVLLAILLSSPIAWLIMNRWLQNFAYKTTLSWFIFLLAGLVALLIALLTVSYQSFKAAQANPSDSLRFE